RVYYCPHAKDAHCFCRKPRPGMLLRARDELNIDMNDALFIGDAITDIHAGLEAGLHTVLVLTGRGREQFNKHSREVKGSFQVAMSLGQAADIILQKLSLTQKTMIRCQESSNESRAL